MNLTLKGVLEIQGDRGVIYFHLEDPADAMKYGAVTVLRISNLPRIRTLDGMIDVRANTEWNKVE